jgi:hypothetical protein
MSDEKIALELLLPKNGSDRGLAAALDAAACVLERRHFGWQPKWPRQRRALVFVDCQFGLEEGKMKGSTKPRRMDEPFYS